MNACSLFLLFVVNEVGDADKHGKLENVYKLCLIVALLMVIMMYL